MLLAFLLAEDERVSHRYVSFRSGVADRGEFDRLSDVAVLRVGPRICLERTDLTLSTLVLLVQNSEETRRDDRFDLCRVLCSELNVLGVERFGDGGGIVG